MSIVKTSIVKAPFGNMPDAPPAGQVSGPEPLYLLRHGETAFNVARRMQGNASASPLTRKGVAQAEAMGQALKAHFAKIGRPVPQMWSSPAPRAVQTAAIIAEHLEIPFFDMRQDWRLREIDVGEWIGRPYHAVEAEYGEIIDKELRLFHLPIPKGEDYRTVAARLRSWLADAGSAPAIVVSHGLTSRLLRGLLAGGVAHEGVQVAPPVAQGSVAQIVDGADRLLWREEERQALHK